MFGVTVRHSDFENHPGFDLYNFDPGWLGPIEFSGNSYAVIGAWNVLHHTNTAVIHLS